MHSKTHHPNRRLRLASSMLILAIGTAAGCDQDSPNGFEPFGTEDSDDNASTGSDSDFDPEPNLATDTPPVAANTIRGVTFYSKQNFTGSKQTVEIPSSYAGRDYKGKIDSGIAANLKSINMRPGCTLTLYTDKDSKHNKLILNTHDQSWWPTEDVKDPNNKNRTTKNKQSFKINCPSSGGNQPLARLFKNDADAVSSSPTGDYFDLWPKTSGGVSINFDDKLDNSWVVTPTGSVKRKDNNYWVNIVAKNGVAIDSLFSDRDIFFEKEYLPSIKTINFYPIASGVSDRDCKGQWGTCFEESSSCGNDGTPAEDYSYISLYYCQGNTYCTSDEICVDGDGFPVGE